MNTTKQWRVDIEIDEHPDGRNTRAEARLHPLDGTLPDHEDLVGEGLARRNPQDTEVPVIGDELATARALSDLSHRLLDAAATDIERRTHRPAYLPE